MQTIDKNNNISRHNRIYAYIVNDLVQESGLKEVSVRQALKSQKPSENGERLQKTMRQRYAAMNKAIEEIKKQFPLNV